MCGTFLSCGPRTIAAARSKPLTAPVVPRRRRVITVAWAVARPVLAPRVTPCALEALPAGLRPGARGLA